MSDLNWMDHAACAKDGIDPNLFFPLKTENEKANEARKVCWGCPVRAACLDYAMSEGIHHGIWGGMSERQRRGIRKSRKQFRSVA